MLLGTHRSSGRCHVALALLIIAQAAIVAGDDAQTEGLFSMVDPVLCCAVDKELPDGSVKAPKKLQFCRTTREC